MKKVGVVVNKDKDIDFAHTKAIVETLYLKGFTPIVSSEVKRSVGSDAIPSTNIYKDADFIICVGGDGTFLSTARAAYKYQVPVMGINRGTVGFLAEVEIKDVEEAIGRMAEGQIMIQSRMVLDTRVIRNGEVVFRDMAINDAVVSRVAISRIIKLRVRMDDTLVDSFPGDGIIVSTPTGSTGYSLSAGGPIVQPDMRLMIITPICPHTLYSRSFIAAEDRVIHISIDDADEVEAMLTMDGQKGSELNPGDLVEVRVAARDALFASVDNINFYDVLRAKIRRS